MPDIQINNSTLNSDDATSAEFWEEGSEISRGFHGEVQDKAVVDTLVIHWKNPDTRYPRKGPEARRIANELEKAGVKVSRHPKK